MLRIIGLYFLVVLSVKSQEIDRPSVNVTQGTVIGSIAEDGDYFAFYGIPYADSTAGVNRFKAPQPPPLFEEPFLANQRGIKCIRSLGQGYDGTEDCLVLDIFTPNVTDTNIVNAPVMVWVKGREFDSDHPELSFKNFVERGIIVVSLNFRESIFGYLCLGHENAPGNAGLKDIIAGLRWVKENIEYFGGDPDNINIVGHGSGGAAVDLVTLSPMAIGLVNRAISQSGSALTPWAVTRDNLKYAVQVAEALGHVVTDIYQLSEIFTRTNVAALMAVINELDLTDNSLAFAPCVEREIEGVEPFLLKSPYQIITDGEMLPVPFMTGYTEYEGTIRAEEAVEKNWLSRMESSFLDFIQPDIQFENEEQRNEIAEIIKTFYFEDSTVDIYEYLSYMGDVLIQVSAIREARLRAAYSSQPVYLYEFSYKGALGDSFQGQLGLDGAAHSEELPYLFSDASSITVPTDRQVSDLVVERWTNFIRNGIPSSSSGLIWFPHSATSPAILIIDDRVDDLQTVLTNPKNEEMRLWNGVYDDHFLDAEGRWSLGDENENESDVTSTTDAAVTDREDIDVVTVTDDPENSTTEAPTDEDGEDDSVPDSAAATVSYTFLIMSLFGVLGKMHFEQIML